MAEPMLYIIRHAEAVPFGTAGIRDDDRPLTGEGEKDAARLGRFLAKLGVEIEGVFTSPLPRARGTAELVAEGLGFEGKVEEIAALGAQRTAGEVFEWLKRLEVERLAIVGHEPWCSDLVRLLADAPGMRFRMRKPGIACFSGTAATGYELEWVLRPRLVRKLMG
jgi:phosphohistidine phosphatase